MEIKEQAANGQPVYIIKRYEELTDEEKNNLILPSEFNIEDFANFRIRYNKKGELIKVWDGDFTKEYMKKSHEESINRGPDLIDSMTLLFGNKHTVQYQRAKKRSKLNNNEINVARKVFQNEAKNI